MNFELLSGIYRIDDKFYKVFKAISGSSYYYNTYCYYKQEVILGKRGKFIWTKYKEKIYIGWNVESLLEQYWYCNEDEKHIYRSPVSIKIALMEKRFKERYDNVSL